MQTDSSALRQPMRSNPRSALPRVAPGRTPVGDDPRWQLVQRITTSRSLGRSPLLSEFLLYICDRQLRGKDADITEQRIGVRVFGRPEGYNSNEDNIVRNYARTLRKRLDEYFETEGTHEALRLEIPRGGYVPLFREATREEPGAGVAQAQPMDGARFSPEGNAFAAAAAGDADQGEALRVLEARETWRGAAMLRRHVRLVVGAGLILMLAAGVWIGHGIAEFSAHRRLSMNAAQAGEGSSFVLWSHLFQQQHDTYIVPADGGLVMMESFTRQPVTLEDYARGTYRNHAAVVELLQPVTSHLTAAQAIKLTHHVETLGSRRYTSIVDLDLASQISRLPGVVPERLMVRYARDLRMDDLRSGNAFLLGSSDANPWVELFQPQLNFRFDKGVDGGSQRIINQHPLPGEQAIYLSADRDPLHTTYGVIALLPNLSETGYVMIIEGINMAGTQAAGEFALSPERMEPILQQVIRGDGTIRSFELLLSTSDVGANASSTQLLSKRIHEP